MVGVKKPHRYCPGTVALSEIRRDQKSTDLLFPRGAIPAPCKGSSAEFKYARFLSTFQCGTFSGNFFVGYARIHGSFQHQTF
eukprot:CCRYP_005148-RB/>CCRYP_005148-RB protein AED:0.21 eAED:0.21 QI:0/-1/0/1/-1/0/1/0/81